MGTEIEFTLNLLATRAHKNSIDLSFVGALEHIENKGLWKNSTKVVADCKLLNPMDRRLDRNSIESIKKTMQKHEDTFKQQVVELHRLYNVQKVLMDELRNEFKQKKLRLPMMNSVGLRQSAACIDSHRQPTKQSAYELDFRFQSVREDPCSRGRSTGACAETRTTVIRSFNLELPTDQENTLFRIPRDDDEGREVVGPSSTMAAVLKSSIMNMDVCDYDESQVELTLSIGGCSQRKKGPKCGQQRELGYSDSLSACTRELHYYSSASFKSDRADQECSTDLITNPISSSSVTMDQERKKQHWLFQGLNLK